MKNNQSVGFPEMEQFWWDFKAPNLQICGFPTWWFLAASRFEAKQFFQWGSTVEVGFGTCKRYRLYKASYKHL